MQKIFRQTWDKVQGDVIRLASLIKPVSGRIKNIYGISRGGLVIAVMLSHQLKIPVITERNLISKQTLITDDIVDSGKTVKELLGKLRSKKDNSMVKIASLWYSPKSKQIIPDYYVQIKKDSWIQFPWETPRRCVHKPEWVQ